MHKYTIKVKEMKVRGMCECDPGYTGSDCSKEINECLLCVNATNCTDLVNDLECECLLGFTGKYCSETIDYCDPDPCIGLGASGCINSMSCVRSKAQREVCWLCDVSHTGLDRWPHS